MDARISVTPDGPYVVTGGPPLRRKRQVRTEQGEPVAWQSEGPLATDPTYALCRCGGSGHKPFCDGSHTDREWDSTTTAVGTGYDERAKDHLGEGVVMRDDRSLCEHAGFCGTRVTNAWKMTKATGDTATRSQLIAMVERCPSGALTHRLTPDGPDIEPDLAAGIGVVDDGPLFVTGRIAVERADGVPVQTRNRMTLCRCGASKNKPLCDGSHAGIGFQDHGPDPE